jgi:hypothetical protein
MKIEVKKVAIANNMPAIAEYLLMVISLSLSSAAPNL